jgi:hypothetical protein
MRSLNDARRGSLWGSTSTGCCRESVFTAQRLFGDQVKPVTPFSPLPRDTRIKVQTDDPSPSAC